jgi:hypothetical protein
MIGQARPLTSMRRVSPLETPYSFDERQLVRRQLDDEMAAADAGWVGSTDPVSGRMRMPGSEPSAMRRTAQLSMGPWADFMDAQTDQRRLAENRGLKFGGVKPAYGMGPTAGEADAMATRKVGPAGRALRSLSGLDDGGGPGEMRPGLRSAVENARGELMLRTLQDANDPLKQWQANETQRWEDFQDLPYNREAQQERDFGLGMDMRSRASLQAARDKSKNYWEFEEPIEQHQFPLKRELATAPAQIAYDRAVDVESMKSATQRAIAQGRQPSSAEFISDFLQGVTSAYRDPRTGQVSLPPDIQALQDRMVGQGRSMLDTGAGPRSGPGPATPGRGPGGPAPAPAPGGGPTAGTAEDLIQRGVAEGFSRQEVIEFLMRKGLLPGGGR